MIVGCHLRHPRPKIEGRFNPFRMTWTEWMWEGRCIEDEWAVGLCKEACKLYLHEQQVAKGTTLGFILSGNYFLKGREKGREPFVSEISHKGISNPPPLERQTKIKKYSNIYIYILHVRCKLLKLKVETDLC